MFRSRTCTNANRIDAFISPTMRFVADQGQKLSAYRVAQTNPAKVVCSLGNPAAMRVHKPIEGGTVHAKKFLHCVLRNSR